MIHALDLHHADVPEAIASYLLDLGSGAFALFDPGPGSTLPRLEAGIAAAGFELAGLTHVLVSHVHLDHAGAAGTLAQRTGATIACHPRAAPHLADPTRLMASARRVYGARLDELWGPMEAVPQGLLRVLEDGDDLDLGPHRVRTIAAPGHANHQHAYLLDDGHLFPGDAAAIRLPGQRAIMPATAPPEIDLEAWGRTLDALEAAAPTRLLMPHFGPKNDVADHLARLRAALPAWAQVIREGLALGEHDRALADRLEAYLRAELAAESVQAEGADRAVRAAGPMMCVMGLRRALGQG
jgi:glyoxylase-like metal-dependent hydrolase (beta-lactamase superfamily II)